MGSIAELANVIKEIRLSGGIYAPSVSTGNRRTPQTELDNLNRL
jgi:hypothetical protein